MATLILVSLTSLLGVSDDAAHSLDHRVHHVLAVPKDDRQVYYAVEDLPSRYI